MSLSAPAPGQSWSGRELSQAAESAAFSCRQIVVRAELMVEQQLHALNRGSAPQAPRGETI